MPPLFESVTVEAFRLTAYCESDPSIIRSSQPLTAMLVNGVTLWSEVKVTVVSPGPVIVTVTSSFPAGLPASIVSMVTVVPEIH